MITLGRADGYRTEHEGFWDAVVSSNVLFLYLSGEHTGVFTFIKLCIYICVLFDICYSSKISSGDLMHSIVMIDNTVLYTWKLLRD